MRRGVLLASFIALILLLVECTISPAGKQPSLTIIGLGEIPNTEVVIGDISLPYLGNYYAGVKEEIFTFNREIDTLVVNSELLTTLTYTSQENGAKIRVNVDISCFKSGQTFLIKSLFIETWNREQKEIVIENVPDACYTLKVLMDLEDDDRRTSGRPVYSINKITVIPVSYTKSLEKNTPFTSPRTISCAPEHNYCMYDVRDCARVRNVLTSEDFECDSSKGFWQCEGVYTAKQKTLDCTVPVLNGAPIISLEAHRFDTPYITCPAGSCTAGIDTTCGVGGEILECADTNGDGCGDGFITVLDRCSGKYICESQGGETQCICNVNECSGLADNGCSGSQEWTCVEDVNNLGCYVKKWNVCQVQESCNIATGRCECPNPEVPKGTLRCSGNERQQYQVPQGQTCPSWQPLPCGSGTECKQVGTAVTCECPFNINACSTPNELKCKVGSLTDRQVCQPVISGSSCKEWKDYTSCPIDQTCSGAGSCACPTNCQDGSYIAISDSNYKFCSVVGNCRDYSETKSCQSYEKVNCPTGQTCIGNQYCVLDNKCSPLDPPRCSADGKTIETCEKDLNGRYIWKLSQQCTSTQICLSGQALAVQGQPICDDAFEGFIDSADSFVVGGDIDNVRVVVSSRFGSYTGRVFLDLYRAETLYLSTNQLVDKPNEVTFKPAFRNIATPANYILKASIDYQGSKVLIAEKTISVKPKLSLLLSFDPAIAFVNNPSNLIMTVKDQNENPVTPSRREVILEINNKPLAWNNCQILPNCITFTPYERGVLTADVTVGYVDNQGIRYIDGNAKTGTEVQDPELFLERNLIDSSGKKTPYEQIAAQDGDVPIGTHTVEICLKQLDVPVIAFVDAAFITPLGESKKLSFQKASNGCYTAAVDFVDVGRQYRIIGSATATATGKVRNIDMDFNTLSDAPPPITSPTKSLTIFIYAGIGIIVAVIIIALIVRRFSKR